MYTRRAPGVVGFLDVSDEFLVTSKGAQQFHCYMSNVRKPTEELVVP